MQSHCKWKLDKERYDMRRELGLPSLFTASVNCDTELTTRRTYVGQNEQAKYKTERKEFEILLDAS